MSAMTNCVNVSLLTLIILIIRAILLLGKQCRLSNSETLFESDTSQFSYSI